MKPTVTEGAFVTTRGSSRKARRQHAKGRRWKRIRNFVVASSVSFFVLAGALTTASFLLPSVRNVRLLLAETIISTRHFYLAHYITTNTEYASLVKQLNGAPVLSTGVTKHVQVTPKPISQSSPVQVQEISGSGYKGYVMLVHDPKLIRLVAADVHQGTGEYITDMAKRVGAIAGTNASGFADPKGEGWGGVPVGLEYVGGQALDTSFNGTWATVGFTNDGVMVMGNYSANQLHNLGVRDAMQFHPELVVNGQPMITYGDGGWGSGPRTAVGQAKDGTVIFVVMNGRFHDSGLGATQKQVMDVMLQYGAWNACAMDGGSSSVLYNDGKIINSPSTIDPNGQRHLPDAWMIFPSEAQANAYSPSA
ncbi:MAG: hypothetical protein A2201_04925 [Alicyclobacillus sp. RIFOXYA1_FULL_53_8]|nr:MAG: hypothetical protein A2201_04925 [Alicyclobacillus sp. RIFOXYA1_FULL_53_8]